MSIFSNFLTSTNLEFISPPRHHPSQLIFLFTYPLLLQSLPLSTSPTPNYAMSHSFPSYPSLLSHYANLCNKPFLSATFLYYYHDLLFPISSPRLILHIIPRQSIPKHTKTRKSSTFFLEFPQLFSWNFLNFFPGMNTVNSRASLMIMGRSF
jgi:hypothetical protein